MYSVVEIAGHQYRVRAGDLIDVEKINAEEGSDINFDAVLFIGGEEPQVGKPLVQGAHVAARVIKHDRAKKVIVFKRKPGYYKRKNGHRQYYTALLITEVNDGKGHTSAIDPSSKEAQKYLQQK